MKNDKHSPKNIIIFTAVLVLSIFLAISTLSYATAMSSKDSQIQTLQTLSVQQQAEIDALKQQINDIQDSTTINLTRQIAEKDAQIANLTGQNEDLTVQNAAAKDEISELHAQINETKPPELTFQEKMRDSVMDYINFNRPETAQFMKDLAWTGGRVTPNLVGAETYVYNSNGWKLTIKYPVVPNPIYEISADYSAPFTGIPYRIIWNGTWQNWSINETSYVFAQ